MKILIRSAMVLGLGLLLSGCGDNNRFADYLLHPRTLQQDLQRCKSLDSSAPQCAEALYAETALPLLVSEQQADPESFGQKLMALQWACVNSPLLLTKAAENISKTPTTQSTPALTSSQPSTMTVTCELQVKAMLAVAGINSPE